MMIFVLLLVLPAFAIRANPDDGDSRHRIAFDVLTLVQNSFPELEVLDESSRDSVDREIMRRCAILSESSPDTISELKSTNDSLAVRAVTLRNLYRTSDFTEADVELARMLENSLMSALGSRHMTAQAARYTFQWAKENELNQEIPQVVPNGCKFLQTVFQETLRPIQKGTDFHELMSKAAFDELSNADDKSLSSLIHKFVSQSRTNS